MNVKSREYQLIKKVIKTNPGISVGDMARLIKIIYT